MLVCDSVPGLLFIYHSAGLEYRRSGITQRPKEVISPSQDEFIQEPRGPLSQLIIHICPAVGALNIPKSNPCAALATGNKLVQASQHLGDLVLFTQFLGSPFCQCTLSGNSRSLSVQAIA